VYNFSEGEDKTMTIQPKKANPEDRRRVLGKAFWKIVAHYGLTQSDQAAILGINENNRDRLKKFKTNNELPRDPDKELRAGHMIGIHKNLRILFPHNREVVYQWLKTPRAQFNDQSAMSYIKDGGPEYQSMMRLAAIRRFLDQVRVGS
jgi:hypothetical protein